MRDHYGGVTCWSIEPDVSIPTQCLPGNSRTSPIRINISLLWNEGSHPKNCPINIALLWSEEQRTKYEVHHSIDILMAAAVAQGAKIKESTVNELSK